MAASLGKIVAMRTSIRSWVLTHLHGNNYLWLLGEAVGSASCATHHTAAGWAWPSVLDSWNIAPQIPAVLPHPFIILILLWLALWRFLDKVWKGRVLSWGEPQRASGSFSLQATASFGVPDDNPFSQPTRAPCSAQVFQCYCILHNTYFKKLLGMGGNIWRNYPAKLAIQD